LDLEYRYENSDPAPHVGAFPKLMKPCHLQQLLSFALSREHASLRHSNQFPPEEENGVANQMILN
jgi:hypothetical protein